MVEILLYVSVYLLVLITLVQLNLRELAQGILQLTIIIIVLGLIGWGLYELYQYIQAELARTIRIPGYKPFGL